MGEMINAYRILVGKPEGNKLLRRLRRRRGSNIKMDLKGIIRETAELNVARIFFDFLAIGNSTSV
jgi:hypothetical protein